MKYSYCDAELSDEKWHYLLKRKLKQAEQVEFNTLYDQNKLNPELLDLSSYLVKEYKKRKGKIYSHGICRRYELSDTVIEFILSKSYSFWLSYQFEDLSLIKDENEILATVTHENQIYLLSIDNEVKELQELGYDFDEPSELSVW